ncbi:unnamed protein product [Orchesella dallaii]|uniref:Chitinase n=1 Tax=Orchesella dallaii TaxID=48710 RepID=A0ABP1QGP1_9HEXA
MKIALLVFLGLVFTSVIAGPVQPAADKKLVCYYGSWAVYRPGNGKFDVESIDPFACTHIIYGFVGLGADNRIQVLDPYNDEEENWGRGAMKRFTGLKSINPNLKALVAIGGWNEGSEKYSKMAMDPAKRRTFVDSVVPFLQKENFDGFDVDWEYPANREGAVPEDRENFILLLRELRAALDPHGYLLTAAVSAGVKTIETAYDIPAVSELLDFINVMAYDFHGAWEDFTGHHSPLGGNPSIDYGDNIMLNTKYAIQYWLDNGAAPEKLILGVGTYGRGFLLDDQTQTGLYAPAGQPIPAGPFTREPGIWGYNEICERLNSEAGQWTVVRDEYYEVPYAYNGRMWIGYEDATSVANKARYVNELGLGGGMVWSIETDDFLGICHSDEKFKIIKTLFRALNGEYPPTPPTTTEDPSNTRPTTTQQTTAAPPPPSDVCQHVGLNPDPTNSCSAVYYACVADGDSWTVYPGRCGAGTLFHPINLNCDFPENVPGCA